MVFVFGGAYQGKLDFVRETFGVKEEEIVRCDQDGTPDLTGRVIYGIEEMTYGMTRRGEDAEKWIADHMAAFEDKILVCTDISRGLVPMDPVERAWREINGRCMNRIAARADEVWSVFCGIGSRVK